MDAHRRVGTRHGCRDRHRPCPDSVVDHRAAHGRHHHPRARTQQPQRIEIWFHTIDGEVYITGTPRRARAWYANLLAHPEFTFHLKNGVQADLAATATPITDADERSAVLGAILDGIDALYAEGDSRPAFPPLEEWVEASPLVRVSFP